MKYQKRMGQDVGSFEEQMRRVQAMPGYKRRRPDLRKDIQRVRSPFSGLMVTPKQLQEEMNRYE